MIKQLTFNPLTSNFDFVNTIPEITADPVSPSPGDAWVLASAFNGIMDGTPIGMLLALTYTGDQGAPTTFQFSYRTSEGTTKRVSLS